jgi:chitinase
MGPANNRQPFLELAYWIGPQPGTVPGALEEVARNLPQYRHDRSHEQDSRLDRWVVMHLHVNDPVHPELFIQNNGRTYIGFDNIQVFHAQGWSVPLRLNDPQMPV